MKLSELTLIIEASKFKSEKYYLLTEVSETETEVLIFNSKNIDFFGLELSGRCLWRR